MAFNQLHRSVFIRFKLIYLLVIFIIVN